MNKNFSHVIESEIIGTDVHFSLKLHDILRFRDEFSKDLESDNLLKKDIGNVKGSTEFTYEYEAKSPEEIAELCIDPSMLA